MQIDQDRSPRTARLHEKLKTLEPTPPGMRELLSEIAELESRVRHIEPACMVYESLMKRIDQILPVGIDRNLLSHIEARKMLTEVRAEVSAAQLQVTKL